jgi:hypothetical protein
MDDTHPLVAAGRGLLRSVNRLRPLGAALTLLLAARAAADAPADATGAPSAPSAPGLGTNFAFGGGFAWFGQQVASGGSRSAGGVALTGKFEGEVAHGIDLGLTLTWGLTDWARAKEYIEAGNRAGQWTTDQLAKVEAWVSKAPKEQKGLRLMGALFADMFLVFTYVAVPSCYIGSAGGATSHLQLDGTATWRLADGPSFPYLEAGIGVAALPYQIVDWRTAAGPVLGAGMQIAGVVRVGGRILWSPTGLNSAPFGGGAILGAITVSGAR